MVEHTTATPNVEEDVVVEDATTVTTTTTVPPPPPPPSGTTPSLPLHQRLARHALVQHCLAWSHHAERLVRIQLHQHKLRQAKKDFGVQYMDLYQGGAPSDEKEACLATARCKVAEWEQSIVELKIQCEQFEQERQRSSRGVSDDDPDNDGLGTVSSSTSTIGNTTISTKFTNATADGTQQQQQTHTQYHDDTTDPQGVSDADDDDSFQVISSP